MIYGPQMTDSQSAPEDTWKLAHSRGVFSFGTFLSTEHLNNETSQALHSNQWNHKGYSFDSQTHSLILPLNNSDKREHLLKVHLHVEIVLKSSTAILLQSPGSYSTGSTKWVSPKSWAAGAQPAPSPKCQTREPEDMGPCLWCPQPRHLREQRSERPRFHSHILVAAPCGEDEGG